MTANYRPRATSKQRAEADADKADKLAGLHERLAEQIAALRTGQDWQRWLAVAARFHAYSFNNTLLILAQRPDATQVAGFEAWKTLGRHVNKGEKGTAILAPILRRPAQDDHADVSDSGATRVGSDAVPSARTAVGEEAAERRLVGYRVTYVWDVAQTDGAPLPEQPAPELLRGQAPDGLWDTLTAQVQSQGYTLTRGDCGSANGLTDPGARTVRIRSDLDDAHPSRPSRTNSPTSASTPPPASCPSAAGSSR
jgi:hypothetical protein